MRMMFSGIEQTGQVPFDTVLIHGIIRDAQGRKMSKSLGNGIDPLAEIDKYGADALRFTLATGNSPGNDMRYMPERAEASRNFANKLWNAARFVLMNLDENEQPPHLPESLTLEQKWIVSQYNELVRKVTENIDKFELGIAVSKLYDFIWDVLCDWYIELSKVSLQKDGESKENSKAVLVYVMSGTLKLLHPFMPFITEEIWQTLPHKGDSIMISEWPEYDEKLSFKAEEQEFERVMTAIKAIRNRRAEMNIPPSKKANIYIVSQYADTFGECAKFFEKLAFAQSVEVRDSFDDAGSVAIITADAKIYIPLAELIDFAAERARLNKELENNMKLLAGVQAKLSNEAFVSKAPKAIVDNQREAAATLTEKISMIKESLAKLPE